MEIGIYFMEKSGTALKAEIKYFPFRNFFQRIDQGNTREMIAPGIAEKSIKEAVRKEMIKDMQMDIPRIVDKMLKD